MWTSHCDNRDEKHKTFKEAFKRVYDYLKGKERLTLQEVETWVWIVPPYVNLPIMFYDARDKAYNEGLLTEAGDWKD